MANKQPNKPDVFMKHISEWVGGVIWSQGHMVIYIDVI